ncbi:transglycosylase SLT domain-containing protein [Paenirhodobacter enshiensis]|uniref:transglycosylase SLT domain-containing protein n=1 Tax=Paenirhodobacter enshiensis TaxID=1105367 RepID=UPI000AA67AAB|nr:transglycosylase SLT domain-containing protein [Paenirhodobacter enshiensis]
MPDRRRLSAVRGIILWLAGVLSALLSVSAIPAVASTPADPPASCERAAEAAARSTGVPLSVLQAITLAEAGRKIGPAMRPWPWTVNMEGEGHFFDSYPEARAYVVEHYKRGARSFDVGCFQINYKWHGEAFTSLDQMFDPGVNALYAARFLSELYAEMGSWKAAAGAYHSRTREQAEKYATRFEQIRARLASAGVDGAGFGMAGGQPGAMMAGGGDGIPDIPDIVAAMNGGQAGPVRPPRVNTYPLLQRAAGARPDAGGAPGASLVSGAIMGDGSWQPVPPSAGSLLRTASAAAPAPATGEAD